MRHLNFFLFWPVIGLLIALLALFIWPDPQKIQEATPQAATQVPNSTPIDTKSTFYKAQDYDLGHLVSSAPSHNTTSTTKTYLSPIQYGPVSYADAVAAAAPAVVSIHTTKSVVQQPTHPLLRQFSNTTGQKKTERGIGSGVIVNEQGYLLTNYHVIRGVDRIFVLLLDGRQTQASIIGIDPESDLAVLKIPLMNLPSVTLAPSSSLRVGDVALAIGNPYGVGQTVTMGIVSAKGRSQLNLNDYENYIQTDAAINRGNSGGALINAMGELIGINTAIYSESGGSEGIGFAIPSDYATQIMVDILENGRVIRGWLGLTTATMNPQLAKQRNYPVNTSGLLVTSALPKGPAHTAGLRPGDIIQGIEGQSLSYSDQALYQVADLKPGQEITIYYLRNGERRSTKAIVGQRPMKKN